MQPHHSPVFIIPSIQAPYDMGKNMQLNLDPGIFDQMVEVIIVLSHSAETLKHNTAADSWLPACRASRQAIRRLIAEDITGRVHLPVSADFLLTREPSVADGTQAWFSKNGPSEYLLVISPPRPAESSAQSPAASFTRLDVTGHHYATLMGDQVREKLEEFQLVAELFDMPPALLEVTTQVESLLREMGSLAMLLQRDQVFASDRIDLNELIQVSLQQLALEDARAGRYELEANLGSLGVIYGSAQWLSYAFEVLFFGLVRGLVPNSHLQISIRQMGDFVIVSGRVVPGIAKKRTIPPAVPTNAAMAACVNRDPVQLSTRMLMAQRILELHSGHLKIAFLPLEVSPDHELAAPIESFSVTLLTGLPLHERSRASCTQCHFALQAQAYAQDIAELMSPS